MNGQNNEYCCENYDDMVKSWKASADAGNVTAAKMLGDLICRGPSGTEKNVAAAFPYWKIAADGGEAKAQMIIGTIYEEGTDTIAPNLDLAMSYYSKAAYRNDPYAQYRLGCMCVYHREEYTLGLHWVCCAHLNGLQEATNYINEWIKRMAYSNDNDDSPYYEAAQYMIAEIQRRGIDPSKCNYSHMSFNATSKKEGCYIATAVYGSYDCPQVWVLRRFRDSVLAAKCYGRAFIRIYYTVSPVLVRWFAHAEWFQAFWREKLDRLVFTLQKRGIESTPYKDKCI